MLNKIVIWLQLISALILLIDAYIPGNQIRVWDRKLKNKILIFSETYKNEHLDADLKRFMVFLLCLVSGPALITIYKWCEVSKLDLGKFGYLSLVIPIISCLLSIRAVSYIRHYEGYVDLLLYGICIQLRKAPKGPIYSFGFILLVISHLVQLCIEYFK